MEAVRQVDSITNTRDRLLHNRSSSKEKSSYYTIQKDTADLSPLATTLSREGMDIKKSSASEENRKLNYDLLFRDALAKKMRAKGEVDKQEEEANANIEIELKKEKTVQNVPQSQSLRFFLSFKFTQFQHSIEDYDQNKHLSLYVRDLVHDIENILNKKLDKPGDQVSQNDLKRIHSSEQEKITNKLIQLIKISASLGSMRKDLEEKDMAELEVPKDQQKEANKKVAKLQEFKLEVKGEEEKTINES